MSPVLPPLPRNGCELILVRHGQSTANALGIGQGRADYPLSEQGRHQAELTARHIATLGPIAAVYTSPLSRAAQTAEAIAHALGLTPRPVDDLVEIDIGELSNRSMAQLKALYPEVVAAFEAAEAARPHPRNREMLPGWERIEAIVGRVWRAIVPLAEAHAGERIVVVAHGGVLNAFLTHLLTGDAHENSWRHSSTNCAISRVSLTAEGPQVTCLTDDSHLAAAATGRTVFDAPAKA